MKRRRRKTKRKSVRSSVKERSARGSNAKCRLSRSNRNVRKLKDWQGRLQRRPLSPKLRVSPKRLSVSARSRKPYANKRRPSSFDWSRKLREGARRKRLKDRGSRTRKTSDRRPKSAESAKRRNC